MSVAMASSLLVRVTVGVSTCLEETSLCRWRGLGSSIAPGVACSTHAGTQLRYCICGFMKINKFDSVTDITRSNLARRV